MTHTDVKPLALVIEDEQDVSTFIKTILEDEGYRVKVGSDGAEGEQLLLSNRPALITLDINLPEKTGVRLYREIRENPELENIPIIIVTGIAKDFRRFISTRRQVPAPDGYINKPFSADKVREVLSELNMASTEEKDSV